MNRIAMGCDPVVGTPPPCFVAGTPIHTIKGLVPIEQIKVGDLVLSKPENGGELAYKPVTRTFVTHEQRVLAIPVMTRKKPEKDRSLQDRYRASRMLIMTPEHPLRTVLDGWMPAEDLARGECLVLSNGDYAEVTDDAGQVLRTTNPQQGIHATEDDFNYGWGQLIDFSCYPAVDFSQFDAPFCDDYGREEMLHTVYNFEVADYHTYFVGDLYDYDESGQPVGDPLGVWVHNTCTPDVLAALLQQPPKLTDVWHESLEASLSGLPSNMVLTDD